MSGNALWGRVSNIETRHYRDLERIRLVCTEKIEPSSTAGVKRHINSTRSALDGSGLRQQGISRDIRRILYTSTRGAFLFIERRDSSVTPIGNNPYSILHRSKASSTTCWTILLMLSPTSWPLWSLKSTNRHCPNSSLILTDSCHSFGTMKVTFPSAMVYFDSGNGMTSWRVRRR